MNKRIKTFINEMKKKGYKLLTKPKKNYLMLTFAKMGIKDLWVDKIIMVSTNTFILHQCIAIDGFNTLTQISHISKNIEECKEKAENEVK